MMYLHGGGFTIASGGAGDSVSRPVREMMRMVHESEMAARHAVDDLRRARRARMHAALLCLAAVVLCLVAIVAARNPHALGLAADDPAAAMGTKGQVR